MLGRSYRFLVITSIFFFFFFFLGGGGGLICLVQEQYTATRVGSNPRPLDLESKVLTTRPTIPPGRSP